MFIESQSRLSYKSGYLVVRKEDDTIKVHLSEISTIILQTTQVYVSGYLLSELAKNKISLVACDESCNPIGEYLPLYGAHNVSGRISDQLIWGEPIKKRVWQHVVKEKIRQQAYFLKSLDYLEVSKKLLSLVGDVRSGDTTNREATAARLYFSTLFGEGFSRDTDCSVNAALNYGYAILLSMVNREIVSRGYLTQCGICHRNEYNQFNLACDFMEPFRPVVDRLISDNLSSEFDRDIRLVLGDMANKSLKYRGGSYRLGSVVSLYVQDCLNALNKKIPVDEIAGFEMP